MAKKNKKPENAPLVSTRFTKARFRYKGVEYISADVEKAAEAGDEEAQNIIANLVKLKSGVIAWETVNEEGGSNE